MDFPRVQLAICAALLILLQLSILNLSESQNWFIFITTTLCLVWQLWWILPYTKL
ncbi:AP endonuclease family 1 domain protein [Vibrio casei]|nr:AP endonuclease family 1 domain protein [Vibrio casei]